jgi:hypothetical protein
MAERAHVPRSQKMLAWLMIFFGVVSLSAFVASYPTLGSVVVIVLVVGLSLKVFMNDV